VAIVECATASTEQELLAHCRARLAPYKVPRRIHLVAPGALPKGLTEKVLNRVLSERYAAPQ
jgi:acyl-CoA synthetase (AMP-forming)/AMP-acid ligase II